MEFTAYTNRCPINCSFSINSTFSPAHSMYHSLSFIIIKSLLLSSVYIILSCILTGRQLLTQLTKRELVDGAVAF